MVAEMGLILLQSFYGIQEPPSPESQGPGYSNTKALGRLLYTDYLYPLEIAAVVLLVAIIAAIALTLRSRKTSKYQNPGDQVAVRREDRIRIVTMPSEPKGD